MEASKRKHAQDLYNQAKKLRVANHDTGFGISVEGCSPIEASQNSPVFSSSLEVEVPDDLPSTCSMNERAIVLYKPTNPELFLSKPIPRAPTIQLDMRYFNAGLLSPESLSDTLQQLGVLRSTPAGPVGVSPKDIPDNRFAVIPWVASSANMPATGLRYDLADETTSQIPSEAMKGDEDMDEDALESEPMDEDDGVYATQSSQPSNPVNNFGTEPWQHYGVPQPQFGSVTWSH